MRSAYTVVSQAACGTSYTTSVTHRILLGLAKALGAVKYPLQAVLLPHLGAMAEGVRPHLSPPVRPTPHCPHLRKLVLCSLRVGPSEVNLELHQVKERQALLQGDELWHLFLVDAALEEKVVGMVGEGDGVIQRVGRNDVADDGAVCSENDSLEVVDGLGRAGALSTPLGPEREETASKSMGSASQQH